MWQKVWGKRETEGERRAWNNFYLLAWVDDPDLTREKSWQRNLMINKYNWRYLQYIMWIWPASGCMYMSKVQAPCKCLGCRFCIFNAEEIKATKVHELGYLIGWGQVHKPLDSILPQLPPVISSSTSWRLLSHQLLSISPLSSSNP